MAVFEQPPKCMIIRFPNWVGDVIMATPVVECLRSNFPDMTIHALTRSYSAKILEGMPWLDSVIPCDDKRPRGVFAAARAVKAANPDCAMILPNSIRALLPFKMARVPLTIGYKRGVRKPFIQGPPAKRDEAGKFLPMPMIDYYLGLCTWMGLDIPESPKPTLFIADDLQRQGDALLERYGISPGDRVIGLNPGAKFGSSKCWPPEHFATLADRLETELKTKLLLFVGPGETAIADAIMEKTSSALINTDSDAIDLALLKPMINRCDLLVTNDTGPRHYATAFGVPVVVIMGPTDPRWTASNLENTIVVRKEMDCSPCHQKVCTAGHECMREVTPEIVVNAALELLNRGASTTP